MAPKSIFASILKKTKASTPSSFVAPVLSTVAPVVISAIPVVTLTTLVRTVTQEDLGRDTTMTIDNTSSPKGAPIPSLQDRYVPSSDHVGQSSKHCSEGGEKQSHQKKSKKSKKTHRDKVLQGLVKEFDSTEEQESI